VGKEEEEKRKKNDRERSERNQEAGGRRKFWRGGEGGTGRIIPTVLVLRDYPIPRRTSRP